MIRAIRYGLIDGFIGWLIIAAFFIWVMPV